MHGNIIVRALTVACLVNVAKPCIMSAQTISEVHYRVESSQFDLQFKKCEGYDVVRLDGARLMAQLGKPRLPVKHIKIALPPGTKAVSVEARSLDSREISGDFFIMPGQLPLPVGQREGETSVLPDPSVYRLNRWYPGTLTLLGHQSNLAGQQIAHIAVYPIQYMPSQRKLHLHTAIELIVHCVADEELENRFQERYYRFTTHQHRLYEDMLKLMVVNPEHVHIDPLKSGPSLLIPSGQYDHVIITSNALASYFDSLIYWHTKKGMRDTVVTTDWIYVNYSGTDDTTKIREFIIDANSNWGTMYFLIGGEGTSVPYGERHYYGDSVGQIAPGDQYYSDFDDDWVHEVYVGRVSGDSEIQIKRFIDKVLKYEKNPPLTDYPLDVLLIGMDLDDDTPAELLKDSIATFVPDYFTINKVYDSHDGNHEDSVEYYLSAGHNLVNHMDHSNQTVMGTGYHHHSWSINTTDVDALTNNNKMSIITTGGCEAGAFDYDDCIGEHFVIYNELKAGVAFIGNSRHGWYYGGDPYSLSSELDLWFWHGLFTQDKNNLGTALVYAKHQFPQTDYDWEKACEWNVNLIGEPAMSIWTDTPATMIVTHDILVPDAPHDFIVTVMEADSITPVESALVCCWVPNQDPEMYVTGYSDAFGNAALNVSAVTPDDTILITVTKHNCLPYEGYAVVTSVVPPVAPNFTEINKLSSDVELVWNQVTMDTLGRQEIVNYYIVYRSTTPQFIPDTSNSVGVVFYPDTVYEDVNALTAGESYYYLVKAADEAENKSKKSNMGYLFRKFLNENAGATADRNWVAMPYHSGYDSVKDVTNDISPYGDPISKISRLDLESQNYYSWIYHLILNWYGNDPIHDNFPIEGGVAYEMIAVSDDTVIFAGCNDPEGLILLNENPGATSDRNWVSIPYNAIYNSVSEITDELSPSGDPVSKITMLDEEVQTYYSWIYHSLLGWYGNHPTTPDFLIESGDGYEFVATRDTIWNPTEHGNGDSSAVLVRGTSRRLDGEFHRGSSVTPDRRPAWSFAETENKRAYSEAATYVSERDFLKKGVSARESGISHIVYADLELEGYEGLLFTVYRPDNPSDVLTERSVGCVIAKQHDTYRLISIDVGNFEHPWYDGEEVILIIEALRDGRGYHSIVNFRLDKGVDIQALTEDIVFIPIPEPVSETNSVHWSEIDNENVIGYSLYRGDERINNRVIVRNAYRTVGEVDLRLVIKGGYETVYGSHGCQDKRDTQIPLSYAFSLVPNPFAMQTRIEYALPQQTEVEIVVYDASGRAVRTLVSGMYRPGYYQIQWMGDDDKRRRAPAGVYFVHLKAEGYQRIEKTILLK